MSDPVAIIVGHQGQDGRLLAPLLRARGESVVGVDRGEVLAPQGMGLGDSIDILDPRQVEELVVTTRPRSIYYLAARHGSSEDGGSDVAVEVRESFGVNVDAFLSFLEAVRRHSPSTRVFYASSSLIFGPCGEDSSQDETTPLSPVGIYAQTKALATGAARACRERHGLFVCAGILYNHESEHRGPTFVSRRIVEGVLDVLAGRAETLELGDPDAVVDWGDARDFVDAFPRILDLNAPDDYVVATGTAHSVLDFARVAFEHVGLDVTRHLRRVTGRVRRSSSRRIGDATKLRRATGWSPATGFETMVRRLVDLAAREEGRRLAPALSR